MEKVKGIFKHYLTSEIIVLVLFTLYLFVNIINKGISDGIDSLIFIIYIIIFIIISLINLILSILFYFINKILPKAESILLILLVFAFTIIFYSYEPPNKYVNVYYKDIPESNYGFYKFFTLTVSVLIIINMLIKFIPFMKVQIKKK